MMNKIKKNILPAVIVILLIFGGFTSKVVTDSTPLQLITGHSWITHEMLFKDSIISGSENNNLKYTFKTDGTVLLDNGTVGIVRWRFEKDFTEITLNADSADEARFDILKLTSDTLTLGAPFSDLDTTFTAEIRLIPYYYP
jgi:hypothetical protein